jgi:hypothetical protein
MLGNEVDEHNCPSSCTVNLLPFCYPAACGPPCVTELNVLNCSLGCELPDGKINVVCFWILSKIASGMC